MSEGDGKPVSYLLDMSGQTALAIKQLKQLAEQLGMGSHVRTALKKIAHRLRTDPLNFGEMVKHLPNLRLLVHHAVVYPLVLRFAVHEEQPIVYLMSVRLVSP
jgi:hypothetical protein